VGGWEREGGQWWQLKAEHLMTAAAWQACRQVGRHAGGLARRQRLAQLLQPSHPASQRLPGHASPLWLMHRGVPWPACIGRVRLFVQAWSDGGYSDDLTVASQCTEQQLTIYCPGYSIFPQW
jgi:hypothetical protein